MLTPGHALAADLAENPIANGDDEAAFFGDGNEARRGNHAQSGMTEAEKSFHAGDATILEKLRLVNNFKSTLINGFAKVLLNIDSIAGVGGETFNVVASAALGPVHGLIRRLAKPFGVG